jgi:hypothetical protein
MVADAAARVESRCPELSLLLRECCSMEPGDRPDAAVAMRRMSTLCALQRLREMLVAHAHRDPDGPVKSVSDTAVSPVVQRHAARLGQALVADDIIVHLHSTLEVSHAVAPGRQLVCQ